MAFAEWLVNRHDNLGVIDTRAEIVTFVASLPLWIIIAKIYGLYDHDEERTDYSTADDFSGVFHMVTVCTFLFWVAAYVTNAAHPSAPKLIIFWASAIAFITVLRATARALARKSVTYLQNTVIVGAGDVGQLIARKILNHPEYGVNLVGFVDSKPKQRRDDLEHLALVGGPERLPAIIRLFDIERVIIAFSNESHAETLELLRSLKDMEVQVDVVPRLFELVGPRVSIHTIEGLPLVGLPPLRLARSSRLLKRSMDLATALVVLVLLAPALAVIALLIKLGSPGPVFYRQVRMGAAGRTFRIYKFRSMSVDADERKDEVAHLNSHLGPGGDARMFKIDGDPRITPIGRWLRRISADELPQLLNVLTGDMSLVGPRPLILSEDIHVADWGRQRLNLRPGLTGLWQVLGRNNIPFEEMVRLDYVYVTSWSLGLDLSLLFRTIPAAIRGV
jgi:exopolysaccharide biosynthesis polyprenyl glycosylphosphotransferase